MGAPRHAQARELMDALRHAQARKLMDALRHAHTEKCRKKETPAKTSSLGMKRRLLFLYFKS